MTLATKSTVISGTPRATSIKIVEAMLIMGSFERRPSASSMPSGSAATMPALEITSVTRKPPQRSVSTFGKPINGKP